MRTTDGLKLIDERFFKGRPDLKLRVEQEVERLRLAERLREMREAEGLSQQELADRVGTQRSVIARIENPGYDRHSMSTLRKVSEALGHVMRIEFAPSKEKSSLRAKVPSKRAADGAGASRAKGRNGTSGPRPAVAARVVGAPPLASVAASAPAARSAKAKG